MKKITLTLIIALIAFGCSKNNPSPTQSTVPVVPIVQNPQDTTTNQQVLPDTITMQLAGGSSSTNQFNYSTNGYVLVDLPTVNRVTVVLDSNEFLQANGSFWQGYSNGNPIYPWPSIEVYDANNVNIHSEYNGTANVSYTYTNTGN